jgi:hypothetical protein
VRKSVGLFNMGILINISVIQHTTQLQQENKRPNSTPYLDITPLFRLPSHQQLIHLMPTAQRRFKLASKSFEGLQVLASRRPDVVLM